MTVGFYSIVQAPLSMEFSRQEYWSELPGPSPGDLPNPGIKLGSSALQADYLSSELPWLTHNMKKLAKFLSNSNALEHCQGQECTTMSPRPNLAHCSLLLRKAHPHSLIHVCIHISEGCHKKRHTASEAKGFTIWPFTEKVFQPLAQYDKYSMYPQRRMINDHLW